MTSTVPAIGLSPAAVEELVSLFDRPADSWSTIRPQLYSFVAKHGWHRFGMGADIGMHGLTLFKAVRETRYHRESRQQLAAASWSVWVVIGCEHHRAINGVCLPPDHTFWGRRHTPFSWNCGCHVLGANSNRSARRLGGDPDKPLPHDWQAEHTAAPPANVDPAWDNVNGPDLAGILMAIINGDVPDHP